MKRRYGTLLLAVVFIITSALSGCGSKAASESSSTPSVAAVSTAAAAATTAAGIDPKTLKPEHLVFVFMGTIPKNLEAVNAEASKYLTEKINATIEIRPIEWGSYTNKTNLMFASREKFDLMFTASWMQEASQAAKEQILPIDDLLKDYAPDYLATIPLDVREAGFINGKAYGLTGNKEWAADKGLVFSKEIADKYGISSETIKTMSDLTPYLEKIKVGEPGMVPLQARSADSPMVGQMSNNAYDVLGDGPGAISRAAADTKVVNMFEQADFMAAAKLAREWFTKGYFNKDAASVTDMTYLAVKAGKAAGYNQSGKPGLAFQEGRQAGKEMIYIPLDKPYMTTGDAASAILAVPTTASDPARSVMFANLLHKDKYLVNLINWGIEGKDYVKESDNVIKYPDGMTAANSTYNLNMNWLMGNQLLDYTWKTDDPKLYELYKPFNDSAERSKALGFTFDTTSVKNEVAAYNNVVLQYTGAIYTGSLDPEVVIPKFVKALKDAGMDKVIAEKQKQLDAFVAAKAK
ncbi:MAG TPA: ABC transporter substrate-binding protein [Ruminiclostridium sp.]